MTAPSVLVSGVVLGQPTGGVRRHAAELLPRLAERLAAGGGRLAVLEGREPIELALPETVERLPSRVPPRPVPLRAARESAALARAVDDARRAGRPFDLVHVAHLPAPRRLPVPFTLTLHDLRSVDQPSAPFVRRLLGKRVIARALADAARVFTVSGATRARLVAGFGVDAHAVDLVRNGIDHFVPLERRPADDPYVLHVGHVEPRKNLELLVRAIPHDPTLPRLVLAGAPKAGEDQRLEALARRLGVDARLELRGAVGEDELRALYAGAHAVALPSLVEGFGIVALEALAAGVPLAVSRIPAHLEVAGPDVPSFAPDDAAECARAIRAALAADGPTLAAGRARAAGFRWDDAADAWAAGLARAAGG